MTICESSANNKGTVGIYLDPVDDLKPHEPKWYGLRFGSHQSSSSWNSRETPASSLTVSSALGVSDVVVSSDSGELGKGGMIDLN